MMEVSKLHSEKGIVTLYYLATIKQAYDSESKMFKRITEAEQWLDEHNPEKKYDTFIEEYDEKWSKIGGYMYTQRLNR